MIENTAVAELLELVMHDRWRDDHPFSPDIVGCQSKLLNPALSRADKAKELLTWLSSTAYPCIFGRIAAKHGQTSVLVLEERDLLRSDREIENLLRDARLEWKRDALEGKKHALVLAAVSPQLANASPDENLCRLTARLCELYLRHGVVPNEILRDELHLRVRFGEPGIIRWQAGVDSFAAPGDQRWWQDHRIPGGICIVINSVGHMARSMIDKALDKDSSLRADIEKMTYEKLTRWALPFAMRTIYKAQTESQCPGTRLAPAEGPNSTLTLDKILATYNTEFYYGWYHTDHTVRREFFYPQSERPSNIDSEQKLDFTYLHKKDNDKEEDDDHVALSLGKRILNLLGVEDYGNDTSTH